MMNILSHGLALPDQMGRFKKGFIVMVLSNLHPKNELLNGTRQIVCNAANNDLLLQIVTGTCNAVEQTPPQISWSPGDNSFPVRGLKRLKFPIPVCFEVRTSKGQRPSSRKMLGIDLSGDGFFHGQLYVMPFRAPILLPLQ